MKSRSTADLCTIARAGGGLELNAAARSVADLCTIARAMGDGGRLIIRGTAARSAADLCTIARAGDGKVIFAE